MNQKHLFAVWGGLFILCAGLGFIPAPEGAVRFLLGALSVCFFIPPAMLVYQGHRDTVKLVRNLSALSLILTALILMLNFVLAFGSETLGNVLHFVLTIVSAPMIASGNWAVSLFLWACLLMVSLKQLKK